MQRWMSMFVAVPLLVALAAPMARADNGLCPAGYKNRTPEQVLEDHRAWLALGDVERDVQCNYARDATVISDMGVDTGRDAMQSISSPKVSGLLVTRLPLT